MNKAVAVNNAARQLLVTCEHGGNQVPAPYRRLFRGHAALLRSHRGYDPGALEFARQMAEHFQCPLHFSEVTRLLVDLNRSLHHRQLFSMISRQLDKAQRREVVERYYEPYRARAEQQILQAVRGGATVYHVSIHSFTPQLDGQVRTADIGLLYDPRRSSERQFCTSLRTALREQNRTLRVKMNYPYLGTADGFTTHLRKQLTPLQYIGIELELNQHWVEKNRPGWQRLRASIIEAFEAAWS